APIHRMDDSGRRERQCSIWCASQPRFAASIAGQPIHGTYLGFKTGKGGDPSETPAARRNTRPKSPNRAERKPTALTYVNSNRRASRSANCWGRWRIEFQSTGARYKRDVIADLRTFEAPSRTQNSMLKRRDYTVSATGPRRVGNTHKPELTRGGFDGSMRNLNCRTARQAIGSPEFRRRSSR